MACVEESGLILLAPAVIPDVRAYSPTGEMLWWIRLDDLLPLDLSETATGGTRMRTPARGHHISATLTSSDDQELAILWEPRRACGFWIKRRGLPGYVVERYTTNWLTSITKIL